MNCIIEVFTPNFVYTWRGICAILVVRVEFDKLGNKVCSSMVHFRAGKTCMWFFHSKGELDCKRKHIC